MRDRCPPRSPTLPQMCNKNTTYIPLGHEFLHRPCGGHTTAYSRPSVLRRPPRAQQAGEPSGRAVQLRIVIDFTKAVCPTIHSFQARFSDDHSPKTFRQTRLIAFSVSSGIRFITPRTILANTVSFKYLSSGTPQLMCRRLRSRALTYMNPTASQLAAHRPKKKVTPLPLWSTFGRTNSRSKPLVYRTSRG